MILISYFAFLSHFLLVLSPALFSPSLPLPNPWLPFPLTLWLLSRLLFSSSCPLGVDPLPLGVRVGRLLTLIWSSVDPNWARSEQVSCISFQTSSSPDTHPGLIETAKQPSLSSELSSPHLALNYQLLKYCWEGGGRAACSLSIPNAGCPCLPKRLKNSFVKQSMNTRSFLTFS